MNALLPHPFLSAGLVLMWLLLNAPPTPGNVLLALLVGLTVPAVMRALRPRPVRVRRPGLAVRLLFTVLYDMLRSNIDVAKIILGLHRGERRTGFVSVPLDMTTPFGLSVLSIILTATPGTLWVQYDSHTGRLLMHLLDDTDSEGWVRRVKDRYERPLMEIFA
ncbi:MULTISPECIES: Na+/H+ antiporter subunit E [Methylorubrum]|jgi:multicomponent K+:H+ antiporter subunit E|uniref:PH adaptation potassium efflux system component(PhaE) n=2 Tax=Methylorubrum extorquens TaxID=408 RepID=C5ATW9_METEA|nr:MULTISPECIES: Na+/H+ antiporter subunit E [Methylorubrum]KQO87197.1 cation:proton antiporter [Methylobacterium sp. Leaf90]MBA9067306.1 multicomponent K+:H+ antiporter subunit E [Methylobacterium sp. RAS18]ACS42668.1 putative pH adaptation potassium efflux system component(phaE) [Methylorubrum extorquens AM1]EHP92050.1 cation antiporter [Methylorubrum extorquens DSM 13060]MCP1544261.1 multicomponent K+:H+ antiporter subunit E [Methylorubrum extorquens]